MKRHPIPSSYPRSGKERAPANAADYCRRRQIDYIFGQFSFSGKYPAAYAREFSCLYRHYRVNKGSAPPPLLRYCLRPGAKAGGQAAADKSYDKGAGAINISLLMPLRPAASRLPPFGKAAAD